MADRVGQQLGNYRLLRLLGTGGFAQVYLGEHIHLGTQAAIKMLNSQLGQAEVDTFRAEARTIAALEHAHIVRVLDFGVENSIPFLVMQFAPQGTLRQRFPKGTILSVETLLPYVKQVVEALHYAHEHRVIHRDIKPENMLLNRDGAVLLSDFGIATVAQSSRSQHTQEIAGTVAYMAPEQIQGHPRPASDQYALAIVVYEWLTGERPFQGSLSELYGKQLYAPPPPLRAKLPSISPVVEEVVLTALAKDPKERFGSVRAFANALEQANKAEPPILFAPTLITPPAPPPVPPTFAPASALPLMPPASEPASVPPTMPLPTVSNSINQTPPTAMPAPPITTPKVTPPAPSPLVVSPATESPARPRQFSRRTIIAAGAAGIIAAGGLATWLTLAKRSTTSLFANCTPSPAARSSSYSSLKAADGGLPTLAITSINGNDITVNGDRWIANELVTLGYGTVSAGSCTPLPIANNPFSVEGSNFQVTFPWPTSIANNTYFLCATGSVSTSVPIFTTQTVTVDSTGKVQLGTTATLTPTASTSVTPRATSTKSAKGTPGNGGSSVHGCASTSSDQAIFSREWLLTTLPASGIALCSKQVGKIFRQEWVLGKLIEMVVPRLEAPTDTNR
jgi:serine/threonine protein kinase